MVKNIPQQKTAPNRQELKAYTEKKIVYEVSDGTSGELDRIKAKLAEREAEITGLEVHLSSISGLKSNLETEVANLKRRNAQLEAEKIQLGSQLEARQLALEEANMAKKVAELDNQNKTRLLKERQELASRTYINSALENQRRVYEGEIETRNLRIEKLESNLKMAEDRLKLG
jgi:sugar phosphate isomerase/epimerase